MNVLPFSSSKASSTFFGQYLPPELTNGSQYSLPIVSTSIFRTLHVSGLDTQAPIH